MNAPTIKSNLPRFGMLVAMKLLLELPTIAELNDFFNCKVIECIGVLCILCTLDKLADVITSSFCLNQLQLWNSKWLSLPPRDGQVLNKA